MVHYLTVWVVTAGGRGLGVPLPSRLRGLGERRKLPQRGPGHSPGRKRVLEYLELEKTPDFTSPDFFHFPWLFPDNFGIPWLFQVFQVSGHPECSYLHNITYKSVDFLKQQRLFKQFKQKEQIHKKVTEIQSQVVIYMPNKM